MGGPSRIPSARKVSEDEDEDSEDSEDSERPKGIPDLEQESSIQVIDMNMEEGGKMPVELSDSIYTSVFLASINVASGELGKPMAAALASIFFCVVVLQATMAAVLHHAVLEVQGDLASTCDETRWHAKIASLSALTIWIMRDIDEAWDLCMYLSFFPWGKRTEVFTVGRFVDTKEDKRVILTRPVSAISDWCIGFIFFTVILTKVVVAGLVMIAGSGGILRASNEFDLILNTVAAVFLLEIDDLAYKVFVPLVLQTKVGQAPSFGLSKTERITSKIRKIRTFSPLLRLLAVAAIDKALISAYWCTPDAPATPYYSAHEV